MTVFTQLGKLRAFEREHLPLLRTVEDFDIVRVVGLYQERDESLYLKQLHLQGIGSFATVTRRLNRLRTGGYVLGSARAGGDLRSVLLTLSPAIQKIYVRYGTLLSSASA